MANTDPQIDEFAEGTTKGEISFTICADLGGEKYLDTVTLILQSSRYSAQGNTFYEKHILRAGEDPEWMYKLRMAATGELFDPELINEASNLGIKSGGVPASTVISLERLATRMMVYDMCSGLMAAYRSGTFTAKNANRDVEIVFSSAECVVTVTMDDSDEDNIVFPSSKCKSVVVGAQLNAENTVSNTYTFSINHLKGTGSK